MAEHSNSGVQCQSVGLGPWPAGHTCVLERDTFKNHDRFVLQMGSYTVGPVFFVVYIKEPSILIVKRRGLHWCSLAWLAADYASHITLHLANP